jgi:PDZ domain-containing protein
MPAAQVLRAGDYILKADDLAIAERDQLLDYIKGKKAGDKIQITYKRGNVQKSDSIVLGTLPPDPTISAGPRPGLGVVPVDVRSVKADDEKKQVTVKAGDIGGPSAGLMFSLEIYNQLVPEDLTKGYRIAGTGTIDPLGHVGVIGGIQHKIVAADREKADIFFAPKDLVPKQGQKFSPILNTTDAMAQAKKIHTKMKVVSIGSIDDAISYLKSLPLQNQEPSGGKARMGD